MSTLMDAASMRLTLLGVAVGMFACTPQPELNVDGGAYPISDVLTTIDTVAASNFVWSLNALRNGDSGYQWSMQFDIVDWQTAALNTWISVGALNSR